MTRRDRDRDDDVPRVAVPADVDAPDRLVWGLTSRQLAILAVAGGVAWLVYRLVGHLVPPVVLVGVAIPYAGLALAVAVGRRDGLPLDVWLLAAVGYHRTPRHQTPTARTPADALPVPVAGNPKLVVPAVLRLGVDRISATGQLAVTGGRHASVVGCGTVNLRLRTGAEQGALVAGFGRWLNSLSGPVQVVVSAQRVDLDTYATAVDDASVRLHHPALKEAAADHAEFLRHLATSRDPLRRAVLVVTSHHEQQAAERAADDAAHALGRIGVTTRVLDGPAVTAVLTTAVDPFTPPPSGPRATPDHTISSATTNSALRSTS